VSDSLLRKDFFPQTVLSAMAHQRKFRQNVGLENMNMTSNYDVTNNAHQIQMTPCTTA